MSALPYAKAHRALNACEVGKNACEIRQGPSEFRQPLIAQQVKSHSQKHMRVRCQARLGQSAWQEGAL